MKKKIVLFILLTVLAAVSLFARNEGPRVGEVFKVDLKAGEIQVSSPKALEEIKMHDILYVRIEGRAVQLKVIFPMMTMARCKPEGAGRTLWSQAKKGMPVYRWNSSVPEQQSDETEGVRSEAKTFGGIEMVLVPGSSRFSAFWIGMYEVTQKQYLEIMGSNPSNNWGKPDNPVEKVTWYGAVEFCNKLSVKAGLKPYYAIEKNWKDPNNMNKEDNVNWTVTINSGANGFRLPTSAEWEYAVRADTSSSYYWGEGKRFKEVDQYAVYKENSYDKGESTQKVGSKKPNAWGLHDMSGNVWEWCYDWSGGKESGLYRVIRGGSWNDRVGYLKSGYVFSNEPHVMVDNIGFRIVRSAP